MMDAEKALAEMDKCCPCAIAGLNQCSANVRRCACIRLARVQQESVGWSANDDLKCLWPGHARVLTLARAAFEAGRDFQFKTLLVGEHPSPPLPKWLPTETSR